MLLVKVTFNFVDAESANSDGKMPSSEAQVHDENCFEEPSDMYGEGAFTTCASLHAFLRPYRSHDSPPLVTIVGTFQEGYGGESASKLQGNALQGQSARTWAVGSHEANRSFTGDNAKPQQWALASWSKQDTQP